MLGFGRGKSILGAGSSTVLAMDIGSEFAKALIFDAKGNKGDIIGFGKHRQDLGNMHNGTITDISGVISTCKKAIQVAEKQAGKIPTKMILGVAGEMVKGHTTVAKHKRPQPDAKIDLAELKNIVHKLQWRCYEEVRTKLAKETGHKEIDIKLINAAIVSIEVDGYKVTNPIGFQGKEVVVTIFNAFAPISHYGTLQTIAAELDIELLAIVAEPYALASAMCLGNKHELNAIIIDVGGGTTDIGVVKEGRLETSEMFMIGGQAFTKRLAHQLNVGYLDAEQIKMAYSNEQLERQSYKVIREALKSDTEMWLAGVELTLNDIVKSKKDLPKHIWICGGGTNLPEIKEALQSPEWQKTLDFPEKPKVEFILPTDMCNLEDNTKAMKGTEYVTPMALASVALDLAGEEQVVNKLLQKVVRLMQVN